MRAVVAQQPLPGSDSSEMTAVENFPGMLSKPDWLRMSVALFENGVGREACLITAWPPADATAVIKEGRHLSGKPLEIAWSMKWNRKGG